MRTQFLESYAAQNNLASTTEAEAAIVETLYLVAKSVAPKFRFGYLDNDDVIQEAVLFGLKVIDDGLYDITKPLENFMRYHIRNRMHNYKRDTFSRTESPCECCSIDYPATNPCAIFEKWKKRNHDKKSLTQANSGGIEYQTYEGESSGNTEFAEIIAMIDDVLPMEYRADYLRMRDGVSIAKSRKLKIKEYIKGVLTDAKEKNS